MSAEHELTKTGMEEAKRQIEIVESQLKSVREEFEESMKLLLQTDGELKETRGKLSQTEGQLQSKESELEATKGALEDEIVVRKAYQENEVVIDEVARGLKVNVHERIGENDALYAKLGKHRRVDQ